MRYFDSLPYISNTDQYGNVTLLKNILLRTELIPKLASNPLLFYEYELRDGDTPEIIANKYYGDSYRYWIVLYGNPQIMDPQFDWPLSSNQFLTYLQNKYADAAGGVDNVLSYTQTAYYRFLKIITTVDNTTGTTAVKTVIVDEDTFYNHTPGLATTQTFADGTSVTYTITKRVLSIYEYENDLNEAKRNIKLINKNYANDMELQYKTLVSS